MACNPPFCEGTGGCGDCNCRCCPPDPCYTSWTYKYYCGTTDTDWDQSIEPNDGCVCPCPSLPFVSPSLGIEFPDFDYEGFKNGFTFNIDEDSEVYAMSSDCSIPKCSIPSCSIPSSCSIPCAIVTIKITTSGCCLYKVGLDDTLFKAVGAGTITAEITGGLIGASSIPKSSIPENYCDGEFQVTINDIPDITFVEDCEYINIEITPPIVDCCSCCSCCKFESSGVRLTGSGPWSLRKKSGDRRSQLLLNPAALRKSLIQKMLKNR